MKNLRKNRIKKPATHRGLLSCQVKYDNADKLVKKIGILSEEDRYMCLVSGNFIFGDFIEAFIVRNNLHVKRLDISTLSLSTENVQSLKNLIEGDYVQELNLHTSSYFFSHERNGIVKTIFKELDICDKFQMTVSGNHTKIVLIETVDGDKHIIHGSSNLRSSDCIEQFMIERDTELFNFNKEFFNILIDKFYTINKEKPGNRGKKLWQGVKQDPKVSLAEKEKPQNEHQQEKNKAWEV